MPSVLLVHPDAESWLEGLAVPHPVAATASAKSARAYLAGTAFDLILVGPDVEGAEAIGALRDVLGLSTAIERVSGRDALAARLGTVEPLPPGVAASEPSPALSSAAPASRGLEHLSGELSRVAHALNNPLAVIAGNAQLALEIAGALGTDEAIVDSLQAIGQAAAELEALFTEVADLRALVDRERGRGGPA